MLFCVELTWGLLTPIANCCIFLASAAFFRLLHSRHVLDWGLMGHKSIAPTAPESDPAAVLAFTHLKQFTFC